MATISGKLSVWADIQYTAQWGLLDAGEHVGVNRQSLTDNDRHVRDWFMDQAKDLGCEIKVDEMGNTFAIMQGEMDSVPPIGMGSHLDTQPAGGRFDGILGVISALHVLRAVKQSGIKTYAPLAAINWTNEEGSRFNKMCSGSGVWSGEESLDAVHTLADLSEPAKTMRTELERIGYRGDTPCSHQQNPLSAHFELHIEQGPRLENSQKKIAVVTGVQGMRWYEINCQGTEAHAGATPMTDRADALVVLAKFTVKVEELARREGAFGTVGILTTNTKSPNTVPGKSFCSLDLRCVKEEVLDTIEGELREYLKEMERERPGISSSMDRTWYKKSVSFDSIARNCVHSAARKVVGESLVEELVSYAGHDSAETTHVTPTAMIFTPSKDGISHNPAEFTTEEDCNTGAEVLLNAVLAYDEYLRQNNKS
ncbi:putative Peptidase M20 [Seiridium unicorne]|uniref:Peptidase M20 n=1 Tax=Seiridium unicorne TaxID=138068 RepID=A0ABR2UQS1_9PEZI